MTIPWFTTTKIVTKLTQNGASWNLVGYNITALAFQLNQNNLLPISMRKMLLVRYIMEQNLMSLSLIS